MIQIPLEIGDLILGGRFKNKKITVKEIGYDEYGSPTVNGRPILKVRIPKLYQTQENNMNESSAKNDPKIEKLVNQINQMIELAVDSDDEPIAVVDKSGTWEEPYIYFPIQYKNGALKITSRSQYKKTPEVEVINKRNMEYDGIPTLRNIAKMYKKTIPMRGKSVQEMTEAKIPSGKLISLDAKVKWGTEKELPFSQGEAIKRVVSQYGIPAIKWGYYKTGSIVGVETKKQKMFWSDKGSTLQFLGILDKGTNEMKKLKENVRRFQSNPIEVKIKKDDAGRWNAILQTVDGDGKELFSIGYETKEQAEHAAMMQGLSFPENTSNMAYQYTRPASPKLESLIRQIVKEERRRLNELDVDDDATSTILEELDNIITTTNQMEAEIKAIEKKYNAAALEKRKKQILSGELAPLLEECKKTDDRVIRTKKVIMKIQEFQSERTTFKYKEFTDWVLTKLNGALKKLSAEFLMANSTVTKINAKVSFSPRESVNESWLGDMVGKVAGFVKKKVLSLKNLGYIWDTVLDKAEKMIARLDK